MPQAIVTTTATRAPAAMPAAALPENLEELIRKAESGADWAEICRIEAANQMAAHHARLIEVLEQIGPAYQICPFLPEPQDLSERAEHLEKVFEALNTYAVAVIADTAANTPSDIKADAKYFADRLTDTAGEICGGIRFAAEQWMEG